MKVYLFIICAWLALFLVAASISQMLVDPDNAYPETQISALSLYRNGGSARRAKASRLRAREYDEIFLGTSRTAVSFDPVDEADETSSYFNAAVTSSGLEEMFGVIESVLAHQHPDTVWLEMSLHVFNFRRVTSRPWVKSPFNDSRPIEESLREFLRWQDIGRAGIVLLNFALGNAVLPRTNEQGLVLTPHLIRDRNERFRVDIRKLIRSEVWFADMTVDESLYEGLQQRIDDLSDAGIHVVLYFPPVHATVLDAMEIAGVYDDYLKLIRRIVEDSEQSPSIEIWDFSGYGEMQTEPPEIADGEASYYLDSSHFVTEVGTCMYRVVNNHPNLPSWCENLGSELTIEAIDQHMEQKDAEKRNSRRENPEQLEWVYERVEASPGFGGSR